MDCSNRVKLKIGVVDIDLVKGVGIYENMSATGKTYLVNTVSKYTTSEYKFSIYRNALEYGNFEKYGFLDDDNIIYIFDRFDMFGNQRVSDIIFESSNKCVLLDYKYGKVRYSRPKRPVNFVKIEIHSGGRVILRNVDVFGRQC